MKGDASDLSFEDSQEDEFEVEDVVQAPDSDDEVEDEWEDVDSDGKPSQSKKDKKKANKAQAMAQAQMLVDNEATDSEEADQVGDLPKP